MKSLMQRKRGVLGLETATAFVVALLTLLIIGFVTIIILGALDDTQVLDPGTYENNATTNILRNGSRGLSSFFSNVPTWFSLLAIVILVLIIVVVIRVVRGTGGGGGGL